MPAEHFLSPERRQDREQARWRGNKKVLLLVLAAGAMTLAACSSGPRPSAHRPATQPTVATPVKAVPLCPLTGSPVPGGGAVPQRPALAVKVDNYPDARPQSGLDHADVIFEEPVEGGITRYAAVFQCQTPPLVGPIRSARNIDIGILGQLGTPLLAHVGGITPVLDNIDASPIVNLDLGANGQVEQHPAGRYAPYDTYANSADLWGLRPDAKTPPTPLFSYSTSTPVGPRVSSVAIPFSGTSNVVWQYVPKISAFQRYYGDAPDVLDDNNQNTAANVIVQYVQVTYGPWAENSEGGMEVQAQLYGTSGKAEVFRSGVEIDGTWQRSALGSPTEYLNASGQPITMQPGQTWVELVPVGINVTSTPGAPAPAPATAATHTPSK
jgi:hypothetical protein